MESALLHLIENLNYFYVDSNAVAGLLRSSYYITPNAHSASLTLSAQRLSESLQLRTMTYKLMPSFAKWVAKQNPAFGVEPVFIPRNRLSACNSLFVFVQAISLNFLTLRLLCTSPSLSLLQLSYDSSKKRVVALCRIVLTTFLNAGNNDIAE
jgi:hypothetical protein